MSTPAPHPRGPRGPRSRSSCGNEYRAAESAADAGAHESERRVRVTCPDCGVVRVLAHDVVVRKCVDDNTWTYRARCSQCDATFVDETPSALALAGVAAGLVVELWTLPRPSRRHAGPPLRAIDALQLHLALREPDWFEQLARIDGSDGHR